MVASIESATTEHGRKVYDILRQILPEAIILTDIKYYKELPVKLDGFTSSQDNSFDDREYRVKKAKEMYNKNVYMTCAVGNDSYDSCNHLAKYKEWVSIGACHFKDGNPKRAVYSSVTEHIDFVSLTCLETQFGIFNGSSCSTPVNQGMAMLVKQFFRDNANINISNKELLNFQKDNSIDLETEGQDSKTGFGLFILPDPKEIEIEKYLGDTRQIKLKIDSNRALVDGKEIILDTEPIIYKNRTLVPIRFIAEALGCNVKWLENTREVIIDYKK